MRVLDEIKGYQQFRPQKIFVHLYRSIPPKVLKYLNKTKDLGLTFQKGHDKLSVFCDADYAKKGADRRSVSGGSCDVWGSGSICDEPHTALCDSLDDGG